MIVVSDYGLPIARGVPLIDLAIRQGLPSFLDVVQSVLAELYVESAVVATELPECHPDIYQSLQAMVRVPFAHVSHKQLKEQAGTATAVVRTGEWTSYCNIILHSGVAF